MSVFPFALICVFFSRQITRGILLISKYVKRQDISARQLIIQRKIFWIGAIYLSFYGTIVLWELYQACHK